MHSKQIMLLVSIAFSIALFFSTNIMHALIQPQLVKIKSINKTILVDLFLADESNFLKQALYPKKADAFVDIRVAQMLDAIQKEIEDSGLGLKVKDAYRPFSVQKQLWEIVLKLDLPNPGNYVSDPVVEGGRHPRGVAVDVTLVYLDDQSELSMPPMGFTQKAHHGYIGDLSKEQIRNRELLKKKMEKHGFVGISCEWWHYNLPNWKEYEAVDINFDDLF